MKRLGETLTALALLVFLFAAGMCVGTLGRGMYAIYSAAN